MIAAVSFAGLESRAVSRSLAQIAEGPEDRVEAYFERSEEVELPTGDAPLSRRARREDGFAVRLSRGERSWIASRDELSKDAFVSAVRQAARTVPQAIYSPPNFELEAFGSEPLEALESFPQRVEETIRQLDAAFAVRMRLRRHRRETLVVGSQFAADPQSEMYYSTEVVLPWGRYGALLHELSESECSAVARSLVGIFRSRRADAVEEGEQAIVLGPAATAVVLHEAVAHTLEADTLGLTGRPEAAVGLELADHSLSVLDDPSSAPASVARSFDDEGNPVVRRWLLRNGCVDQPLADAMFALESPALLAGAARRADRHSVPGPRSMHLELLPGEAEDSELLSDAVFFEQVERGRLDPRSGWFEVVFPWGRRARSGKLGSYVGRARLRARVTDLLGSVVGIGATPASAGAGWCAKGGQRLPVWATAPSIRLEGLRVVSA